MNDVYHYHIFTTWSHCCYSPLLRLAHHAVLPEGSPGATQIVGIFKDVYKEPYSLLQHALLGHQAARIRTTISGIVSVLLTDVNRRTT